MKEARHSALRKAIVDLTVTAMHLQNAGLFGSHDLVVATRQDLIRQFDELRAEDDDELATPSLSRID